MAEGQNSTPPKKTGGRIMRLEITNPSDIMHTLIPYTQHLTQLTFCGMLPNNMKSMFDGISIHNPMLEDLNVKGCYLTPDELSALVSYLPKLGNLEKLTFSFNEMFLNDAMSLSVSLDCPQTCPQLKNLVLIGGVITALKVPSVLFSSLQPLLVNKLKGITLDSIALNSSAAEVVSCSLQSQHCSLVSLTLFGCHLLSNASKQLANGIGRNTSLRRVVFQYCHLGSADFKVLADALKDNKTLKQVYIKRFSKPMIDGAVIQELILCNQNIFVDVRLY